MRRIVSIATIAATLVFGIASLSTGRETFAQTAQTKTAATEISIDNFSFGPVALTVAAGTEVTWTNRDDIPHTVVSTDDPKAFKSKVLDTNDKFSFTFTKPGTYSYFCSLHPKMTGKVIVQ